MSEDQFRKLAEAHAGGAMALGVQRDDFCPDCNVTVFAP